MKCCKCNNNVTIVMNMSGRGYCKPHYDSITILKGDAVDIAYRTHEAIQKAKAFSSYKKSKDNIGNPFKRRWGT